MADLGKRSRSEVDGETPDSKRPCLSPSEVTADQRAEPPLPTTNADEQKTVPNDEMESSDNENSSDDESDEESSSVDSEFAKLSRKDKYLQWLAEEKESGTTPQELFGFFGVSQYIPLLNVKFSDLWMFWDLVGREDDPLEFLSDLVEELHDQFYARKKLPHINTHEDAIEAIKKAQKILVITGAGISVSCGIPDFRSPGGLYDQISAKFGLDDPHLLFDIHYLKQNPVPFFEFAKQLYPTSTQRPSDSHMFIRLLETEGKLLRHYTQNIDTLERIAGSDKSVQCHGSFLTASCISCKKQVPGESLRSRIMNNEVPLCEFCNDPKSFMKPDIVFFGEQLPQNFKEMIFEDCRQCDLLIVMGSSLRVQPVNMIPRLLGEERPDIPQILLNNHLVMEPHEWDFFYEGACDDSVRKIATSLELEIPAPQSEEKDPVV